MHPSRVSSPARASWREDSGRLPVSSAACFEGGHRARQPQGAYLVAPTAKSERSFRIQGYGLQASGARVILITRSNQIITREVSASALLNTVRNPSVVLRQSGGNYLHLSPQAGVVLRPDGQVVTAYSSAQFKPHIIQILQDAGAIP